MISESETEELINKFVTVRDNYKLTNSEDLKKQYKNLINICVNKFDYIVINRAKKYQSFSNYEDLVQDGRIGIMMALDSYQLGKGSWYWWCNQYVKTRLSREANRHSTIRISLKKSAKNAPMKIQMPVFIDENTAEDYYISLQDKQSINKYIMRLPVKQRKIIQSYFEFEESGTIQSIGKELNISAKECSSLLQDAKEKIKNFIKSENEYS